LPGILIQPVWKRRRLSMTTINRLPSTPFSSPQEYPERPGAHTEDYWQAALPYQLLFFQQVLQANSVLLP
jgi:hypothetical protein